MRACVATECPALLQGCSVRRWVDQRLGCVVQDVQAEWSGRPGCLELLPVARQGVAVEA